MCDNVIKDNNSSQKDTENKDFLNVIIKYSAPIIGGALLLGTAILGVNVKGQNI